MKRIVFTAVAIVMMTLSAYAAPVTLQFWGAIQPDQGPQDLVDAWNKANPDIKVEYTRFVNDDAGNLKLETAVLAGQVDVFITYPVVALDKRIAAGMMAPLNEYIRKAGLDLPRTFGETVYERNNVNYYLPTLGGNNTYFIYNKDMLDAAGISIPDRWTWEDYEELAKKLTKGTGVNKVFGTSFGGTIAADDWALVPRYVLGGDFYYKEGGMESNFDHPLFLQALRMLHRMMVVDRTMINRMIVKSTKMDIADEFTKGRIAIMCLANYHIRDIKNLAKYPHTFRTALAPAPTIPGQTKVYSAGLREWISIASRSKNKDQAWEFLRYYSMEGYYPMGKSNRFPAWKGADASKVMELVLGPDKDRIFDVPSFRTWGILDPNIVNSISTITTAQAQIFQLMGTTFEKVLLNQATPEQAAKDLKIAADKAIADERARMR